jgi:glyoxylase-like metal-dependent hydrolase (beta-lactamase superfamily II)
MMAESLGNPRWAYTRGLHDLGNGAYAWLQPDGGWGWSNAGLVVSEGESLLVDTLFDLPLTRDMLAAMKDAEPKAAVSIDTLINTHSNADHVNGNELVKGATIIASSSAAEEMAADSPERLAKMMRAAPGMGQVGRWFLDSFGPFDFEGITQTLPTQTFERRLETRVGEKRIELLTVGPAHTRGDILVHVPDDRTVFTGDILFVEGHPIIWEGPVQNWIDALRLIEEMDVETVVPGHGPITDKRAATALREYFEYIGAETEKRFHAGLSAFEAAKDIELTDYDSWGDSERIVISVAEIYRELAGEEAAEGSILDRNTLFAQMAELAES